MKNLNNKKVLILGMGSTGLSICNFLKNKKIDIYCWDDNKCKLENIEKSFSIYSNQKLDYLNVYMYHQELVKITR